MATTVERIPNEQTQRVQKQLVAGEPPSFDKHVGVQEKDELIHEVLFELFDAKPDQEEVNLIRRALPDYVELVDQLHLLSQRSVSQKNAEDEIGVGDPIGRYVVVDHLGEGNFGLVLKGFDRELNRHVALKIPKRSSRLAPRDMERFRREGHALAQLRHPNILTVHDVTQVDENRPVLVLEYLEGNEFDVDRPLDSNWTDDPRLAQLISVCEALAHAHSMGFVHRDLKPTNILIDHTGRPVVVDFGLSLHSKVQAETSGQLAGTLYFMAPEQARGEIDRIDGRTDIWAIGAILFKLLTGEFPYYQSEPSDLLAAAQSGDVPAPQTINLQASRALSKICQRCLSVENDDRFASMQDLADAFRYHIQKEQRGLTTRRAVIGFVAVAVILGMTGIVQHRAPTPSQNTPSQNTPTQNKPAMVATPTLGETPGPFSEVRYVAGQQKQSHETFLGSFSYQNQRTFDLLIENPNDTPVRFESLALNGDISFVDKKPTFPLTIGPEKLHRVKLVADPEDAGNFFGTAELQKAETRTCFTMKVYGYRYPVDVGPTQVANVSLGESSRRSVYQKGNGFSETQDSFAYESDFLVGTGDGSESSLRILFNVEPGRYRVSSTWPPNRSFSRRVKLIVSDGRWGSAAKKWSFSQNQTLPPDDLVADDHHWEILGEVDVSSRQLYVYLYNETPGETIVADAIRVEPIRSPVAMD